MTPPHPERVIERGEALSLLRSNSFSTVAPIVAVEGVLHYRLYGQDGQFQSMTCCDTLENRKFVEWTRMFDRYTPKVQP